MVTIAYLNELSHHMEIGISYTSRKIIELVNGRIPGEIGFNKNLATLEEAIEFLEGEKLITKSTIKNSSNNPSYEERYTLLGYYFPNKKTNL